MPNCDLRKRLTKYTSILTFRINYYEAEMLIRLMFLASVSLCKVEDTYNIIIA